MEIEVLERANKLRCDIQEINNAINILMASEDVNINISKYLHNRRVNLDCLLAKDALLKIEYMVVSQLEQRKKALEEEFEDL